MDIDVFLHMGKKKKKKRGDGSIMKLGILSFSLGRFTNK
jgi:hypothetical protein